MFLVSQFCWRTKKYYLTLASAQAAKSFPLLSFEEYITHYLFCTSLMMSIGHFGNLLPFHFLSEVLNIHGPRHYPSRSVSVGTGFHTTCFTNSCNKCFSGSLIQDQRIFPFFKHRALCRWSIGVRCDVVETHRELSAVFGWSQADRFWHGSERDRRVHIRLNDPKRGRKRGGFRKRPKWKRRREQKSQEND